MGMRNVAWVKLLANILVWVACAFAVPAMAQSACTALWGTIDNNGATAGSVTSLRYFNTVTNRWTNLSPAVTLVGNGNAISGDPSTGLLYYVDRTAGTLHSYNLNNQVDTDLGAIPLSGPVTTGNILGATMVAPGGAGNLFLYWAENIGGTGTNIATDREYVGRVTSFAPLAITWTQILIVGTNANPLLGISGDLFTDQANRSFIASNTAPNSLWSLDLNPASATYSRVTQTVALSSSEITLWGAAINPVSGQLYVGFNTATTVTGVVNTSTGAVSVLDNQTVYGVSDLGNCVAAPARPTITKSFNPIYQPSATGISTLTINIGNTNSAPVWLFTDFVDNLPPGVVVANPPLLNTGLCGSIGTTVTNVITATAGLTTVTFAAGGRIPAGGCSISLSVSASASNSAYTNTIPAGSLSTTAGNNPTAATATFKVGTDFSATKAQCVGVCGTPVTTAISLNNGQTVQYVLTISNSSVGGTGSATFSDTLPIALTPVLSVTAAAIGGGTCTTSTVVVGGATQINGTLANAPAGAQCLVTVTALVSTQVSTNTVTNTLTIATTAGTADTNATNNTAAVVTNLVAATILNITKTNNISIIAAGNTTSYTVTIANLGPANAPNSIVKDPTATGLSCTTATCAVASGTAVCPVGTPSALLLALQSPGGLTIPTFNSGSSLNFVVTCGVTATGQ